MGTPEPKFDTTDDNTALAWAGLEVIILFVFMVTFPFIAAVVRANTPWIMADGAIDVCYMLGSIILWCGALFAFIQRVAP